MSDKMITLLAEGNNIKVVNGFKGIVNTLKGLTELVQSYTYSLSIFSNNTVSKANFLEASFMAIDVDENLSIKGAIERIKDLGLMALISFSKSHQKPKKDAPACDRFRVIFQLQNKIKSIEEYNRYYIYILNVFPEADRACKDPSRRFYPSTGVDKEYGNNALLFDGKELDINKLIRSDLSPFSDIVRFCEKRQSTKYFLYSAHTGLKSKWNNYFNSTVFQLASNGFDESRVLEFLERISPNDLDNQDIAVFRSAFHSGENKADNSYYAEKSSREQSLAETITSLISNEYFILYKGDIETIVKVNENKIVRTLKTNELKKEIINYCKSLGKKYSNSLISNTEALIQLSLNDLEEIPRIISFKSSNDLTFKRLDFDPVDGESKVFDEFLCRCDNPEALCAYIWSLFDEKSYNQQYLYIYGDGGDGKGTLIRFLQRIFEESFISMEAPTYNDRYYTSALVNKRIIAIPDLSDKKIFSNPIFKNITGGEPVKIEFKYKNTTSTTLDCKFIIASNLVPTIKNINAEKRRIIPCHISSIKNEYDSAYLEKLWSERSAILYKCKEAYLKLASKHTPIKSSQKSLDAILNNRNEVFNNIFESKYTLGEGKIKQEVLYNELHTLVKRYGFDFSDFKDWLEKEKRLKVVRSSPYSKRYYKGIVQVSDF
jgi:hypothetical protein